jgi:hypothetical protein
MVNRSVPVINAFGDKRWRNEAWQLHRIDGPAIETTDGKKYWWRYGVWFRNKEEFFDSLTEEEKAVALFSKDFLNE